MIYSKFLLNLTSVIGLSFLLTCVSVYADDKRDLEKAGNSAKNDTTRTYDEAAHVKLGPTNLAYDINAQKLIDMNVVGQNGNTLGEIQDLVLSHNKTISYAIVSVGGILGVGEKLVTIPFHDLNINKTEEKVTLNLTEKQLEELPEFKFEYIGDRNYQTNDRPTTSSADSKYNVANTDYDINAKKLFGMNVVDPSGKKLGELKDLLLSKSEKVIHAIVSTGGMLGMGKKLIAVPFHSLQVNKTDEKIILNVTEKQLEQAADFKFSN
ncbi:PRC-barrel domain-containing protein [Nitrosomonas sp.]|uniref:PRC-barrel domain-containing protein n=1 Tax=Nitrosomonas sp. TaxID=42353 RepID=UPI0026157A9F|nr:PRC-barrel domain-containing protein [Nitrosomonas sp.]MCW5601474.1 PRC-barrel domain-containing protein [Nitrosomonas sp.]